MKLFFGTHLLILCLFVFMANSGWACGDSSTERNTNHHPVSDTKSCCSKEGAKAGCGNITSQQDSNCPCGQGDKDCQCPGCGMMCHGGAFAADCFESPVLESLQNSLVQKQAFYFAQYMPEDVYPSIWQPPEIGA